MTKCGNRSTSRKITRAIEMGGFYVCQGIHVNLRVQPDLLPVRDVVEGLDHGLSCHKLLVVTDGLIEISSNLGKERGAESHGESTRCDYGIVFMDASQALDVRFSQT